MRDVGAMCMGSGTYEWLLRHHLKPGTPEARPWDYEQPTWVFTSRALPRLPDADVRFVRGDVRPVHDAMVEAARGRNVWVMGGGELAAQFHDAGLLDELILHVASVTLGSGRPLFPRSAWRPPFRLVSARRHGDAFAELRYEVIRA
jgi:dihydrofolate reductase